MSLRALLPALALLGCSEYNLAGEEKPTPGGEETGTPPCTPPDPACTDSADPDTGEDTPIDTSPVDIDDCEAPTAEAGTVTILDDCIGTGSEPVADPYNLQIEYSYTSDGNGPVVKPSVTNLTDDNGDGMVDTNDIPDIVFTVYGSGSLVALSGDYWGRSSASRAGRGPAMSSPPMSTPTATPTSAALTGAAGCSVSTTPGP